jgi:hypothetical protein
MHHRIVSSSSSSPNILAVRASTAELMRWHFDRDLDFDRKKPTFSHYWLNGCPSSKRVRGRVGNI